MFILTWSAKAHLLGGLVMCFCASMPASYAEISTGITMGLAGLRLSWMGGVYLQLLRAPAFLFALAWGLWMFLSIQWSPDRTAGLMTEAGQWRWILAFFALYPLLPFRRALIAAYLSGFVLGHLAQAIDAAGGSRLVETIFGLSRGEDRIAGYWGAVAGGTALSGALGLHVGALATSHGAGRRLPLAGTALTLLGLAAIGTRGAWVAGGVVLMLGAAWWMRLRVSAAQGRARGVTVPVVVVLLALAAGGGAMWPRVQTRVEQARNEIALAREGEFETNIGARLVMWEEAWHAFARHPVRGVGAGGYQTFARAHLAAHDPDISPRVIHGHAHGTPVHIAATQGLVGLSLFCGFVVFSMRAGFRARLASGGRDHSPYARAAWLGLAGLLAAGLFETLHVGTRVGVHLWILVALCHAPRPELRPVRWRGWPPRVGPGAG